MWYWLIYENRIRLININIIHYRLIGLIFKIKSSIIKETRIIIGYLLQ